MTGLQKPNRRFDYCGADEPLCAAVASAAVFEGFYSEKFPQVAPDDNSVERNVPGFVCLPIQGKLHAHFNDSSSLGCCLDRKHSSESGRLIIETCMNAFFYRERYKLGNVPSTELSLGSRPA